MPVGLREEDISNSRERNRPENIPEIVDLCFFKRINVNSQNGQYISANSVKYSVYSLVEIILITQNTRDHKKKCASTRMFDNPLNELSLYLFTYKGNWYTRTETWRIFF